MGKICKSVVIAKIHLPLSRWIDFLLSLCKIVVCKVKRRFIFEYVWLIAAAEFIRKCKIILTKNVVLNIDKGVRLCYYLYINIIIGVKNGRSQNNRDKKEHIRGQRQGCGASAFVSS